MITVLVIVAGCSDDAIVNGGQTVDEVIADAGQFVRALPRADSGMGFINELIDVDGYKYSSFSHKRNIRHRFERFPVLYDSDTNLFPGVVIRGDSLRNGRYVPIPVARSPITVSIHGRDSTVVMQPTFSAVHSVIEKIVKDQRPEPGEITVEVTPMWLTTDAAFLMLGQQANWIYPSVRKQLEVDRSVYTANTLLVIQRPHFQVKTTPAQIERTADIDTLRAYVGPDNPPVYAATVDYGRKVIVHIHANMEQRIFDSLLNASVSTYRSTSSFGSFPSPVTMRIRAVVFGARGEDAALVHEFTSLAELSAFVNKGMEIPNDDIGVPVSFHAHHVHGNAPVTLNSSADYSIPTWKHLPGSRVWYYVKLESIRIDEMCNSDEIEKGQFYCLFGVKRPDGNIGGYRTFPVNVIDNFFEASNGDVIVPPSGYREVVDVQYRLDVETTMFVYADIVQKMPWPVNVVVFKSDPIPITFPFDSTLYDKPLVFDVQSQDGCRAQVKLKVSRTR